MNSRRNRIENKRNTRQGLLMLLASVALLVFLVFVGLKGAAKVALFLDSFRGGDQRANPDDKTPPGPPRIDDLPEFSRTEDFSFQGFAEADSTVKVKVNGVDATTSLAGSDSKFSVSVKLEKGANLLSVTATDQSGNESEPNLRSVLYDTEAPKLEVENPQDGSESIQKTITVSGVTDPDVERLTINDRVATMAEDGRFSARYTLAEGENSLIIVATDKAENKTEKTIKVTYFP